MTYSTSPGGEYLSVAERTFDANLPHPTCDPHRYLGSSPRILAGRLKKPLFSFLLKLIFVFRIFLIKKLGKIVSE